MIHLYIGDGAGKTTAAVGLAVRAAGRGKRVLFVQFLKDGTSGEIAVLRGVTNVTVLHAPVHYGFLSRMTADQRQKTAAACRDLLDAVRSSPGRADESRETGTGGARGTNVGADAAHNADSYKDTDAGLVVLDEVLHALDAGLVGREDLEPLLGRNWEIVLTGRAAPDWLIERADYVSEVCKRKHPYDWGVRAREGVEF